MTLKLYFHPLASYCHKVLIALYEHDIAFAPILVDLGDEKSSAEIRALWPLAKFPVLRDEARNCTVAHYRVSRRLPPRWDALCTRSWRSRLANTDVGPLLRLVCPGTHAEDRRRSAAPRGPN
jgi:glutathione S-transferase